MVCNGSICAVSLSGELVERSERTGGSLVCAPNESRRRRQHPAETVYCDVGDGLSHTTLWRSSIEAQRSGAHATGEGAVSCVPTELLVGGREALMRQSAGSALVPLSTASRNGRKRTHNKDISSTLQSLLVCWPAATCAPTEFLCALTSLVVEQVAVIIKWLPLSGNESSSSGGHVGGVGDRHKEVQFNG